MDSCAKCRFRRIAYEPEPAWRLGVRVPLILASLVGGLGWLGCSSGSDMKSDVHDVPNAGGTTASTEGNATGEMGAGGASATGPAVGRGGQVSETGAGGAGKGPITGGTARQDSETGGTATGPSGAGGASGGAPVGSAGAAAAAAAAGKGNTGGAGSPNRGGASGGSAVGGRRDGGSSGGGGAIGAAADGGASASSDPTPSAGCGAAKTTSECGKSGSTCPLQVNGKDRVYYLQLPSGYSSSKPYPVVFQFHPMGGTAEQGLTMYNVAKGMPDAIYITPQGLVTAASPSRTSSGQTGWANADDEDIEFTKAMLSQAEETYCVDSSRVFSVGFSYGGMMSFAIGLEIGNIFRAIAPMSGALYSNQASHNRSHPIAMWGAHGANDTFVPTADGRKARDLILAENHCGTTTTPVDPSPCVAYEGCDPGYPVIWCEWNGSHAIANFGSGVNTGTTIANFFKQF